MNFVSARPPTTAAPFARVAVHDSFDAARAAWATLSASATASPYQQIGLAELWVKRLSAPGDRPFIIVAEDEAGAPAALLSLTIRQRAGLRIAAFPGGRESNLNLGLFRRPEHWRRDDVISLLRRAGGGRVDLFHFAHSPEAWQGAANPLAALDRAPAPSPLFLSRLPDNFAAWFDAHFSKETRKKLDKKRKGLAKSGQVRFAAADSRETTEEALTAFLAHRDARAKAGVPNPYAEPGTQAYLRRIAGLDGSDFAPILRLTTLHCGDRIVAVFGAFCAGRHISGVITSFDAEEPFGRASPGELLLHDTIEDAIARGIASFDLGVGDGRYKRETCEEEIALFDSALPLTARGVVAAAAARARTAAKRRLKASPAAMALLRRLRAQAER